MLNYEVLTLRATLYYKKQRHININRLLEHYYHETDHILKVKTDQLEDNTSLLPSHWSDKTII